MTTGIPQVQIQNIVLASLHGLTFEFRSSLAETSETCAEMIKARRVNSRGTF